MIARKIRDQNQLGKLSDKHSYTWTHGVDPLGRETWKGLVSRVSKEDNIKLKAVSLAN